MKTKALVLKKYGDAHQAFEERTISLPLLKSNEVLIEVSAFGLNFADIMARKKMYREAPPLPAVLGYESVGKVIEVGSEVKNKALLGQKVLAFTPFGSYAKHVITSENMVIPILQEMNENHALALATQYVTALYMSEILMNIHEQENILIHAASGGVGLALNELLKNKNVQIFSKVGNEDKKKALKSIGIEHVINYKTENYSTYITSIIGSKKLDVSFNPVAGNTIQTDWQLLNSGGRLVLFGASKRLNFGKSFFSDLYFLLQMKRIIPIFAMMQSKSLLGVNMLAIAKNKPNLIECGLNEVLNRYQNKEIQVHFGEEFRHTDLHLAHQKMENGSHLGKISVHF